MALELGRVLEPSSFVGFWEEGWRSRTRLSPPKPTAMAGSEASGNQGNGWGRDRGAFKLLAGGLKTRTPSSLPHGKGEHGI